ncbi:hypothetical protein Taro_049856 [Colocasia esculenta]|uniref:Uncharacterized protein n=1 Tax=Colocasia esculenta TaxID=4460 RepID=A0A843XC67_COLES|nr:hypothetical protein [Colocasia esculenta]
MESFQKQCDKEYMKMAMLKHEETFKEQVGELHRLYRIQKMLMRDMKRNALKQSGVLGRSPHQPCRGYQLQGNPRRPLDLERPAEEEEDGGVEEESEIELTLATGSRRRKKEEAASFTSDSATSFSSSSTESGGENSKFQDWGMLQMQDVNRGRTKGHRFGVHGTGSEDRMEQPPWLFQCLSLNMT